MGMDSVFFKGLGAGSVTVLWSRWVTQIELGYFFPSFFVGEGVTRVGELTCEDWEVNMIEVHDVKFPNNE